MIPTLLILIVAALLIYGLTESLTVTFVLMIIILWCYDSIETMKVSPKTEVKHVQ